MMRRGIAALYASGAVLLSACTSDAGPIDPSLDAFDVRSISVSPEVDTIFAADTIRPTDRLQLTATIKGVGDKPFEGARAVWYSEDSTVADVSESGVVRPFRYGTVRIVASASKKGYATVVIAPAVGRVTIAPALDTMFVREPIVPGDTARLRSNALDAAGRVVVGSRFTWSSSNPAVATVDSTGLVRSISPGSTTISARSSGVTGISTFVAAPRFKSVSVATPVTRVLALDTVQLTGTAFDYANLPIPGVAFSWTSSNTAVATVDATGRVLAVGPGTVSITASGNFRSSNVTLAVLDRQLLNVQAGGDFSCGTAPLGRLYCWGSSRFDQLASPADSSCFDDMNRSLSRGPCTLVPKRQAGPAIEFAQVATGGSFACGLSLARQIYCWGSDDSGQIGNGAVGGGTLPSLATVLAVQFDAISAGRRHACALTSTGAAYCWGADSSGQLGDRRRVNSTTPIPVYGGASFRSISAGGAHTCGIRTDGQAICWGDNEKGQLGIGTVGGIVDQPNTPIAGGPYATISAGYQHTCALTTTGRAFCWGDNSRGQLGIGTTSTALVSSPTAVATASSFSSISAGQFFPSLSLPMENRSHTCAITSAGDAYCWGDNYWRQSGSDGDATEFVAPNLIATPSGASFRSISTGSRHSCAYSASGTAWCWGSNVLGALGNGLQAAGRSEPQQVLRPR